ncbi:hypothetical protein KCP70_19240 [Salmonella enterica subsp. enterica]|nr:hypothetical protein KCP70_19240 [Salmonella enterica subsp. enterica]
MPESAAQLSAGNIRWTSIAWLLRPLEILKPTLTEEYALPCQLTKVCPQVTAANITAIKSRLFRGEGVRKSEHYSMRRYIPDQAIFRHAEFIRYYRNDYWPVSPVHFKTLRIYRKRYNERKESQTPQNGDPYANTPDLNNRNNLHSFLNCRSEEESRIC